MDAKLVLSIARGLGVSVQVLDDSERSNLISRLRERLHVNVTSHRPWDSDNAPDGQVRPDGWKLIPAYTANLPCFVFFDGAPQIMAFSSGNELLSTLKECPALEFYVCDSSAEYLLCHNHHDVVVGWGSAQSWVDRLGSLIE